MSDASVHCEVVSGIAFITLCHPPVNSFNLGLRRELLAALGRVACMPSAEAVVLSGAGRGFSAGGDISRQYAPIARAAGAIVIDNSSVFRMEPDVPLVIPEINGDDVRLHRGLIANPNCTTAVALMAIYPLHRAFGVRGETLKDLAHFLVERKS